MYFCPKQNSDYEAYVSLNKAAITCDSRSISHSFYVNSLQTCEFTHLDREVKIQIIQGCTSSRRRRRALRDPKITLSDLLSHGRALEMFEIQATGMEQASCRSSREVNHLHINNQRPRDNHHQKPLRKGSNRCRNCGGQWPHKNGRTSCPAYGTVCFKCGKSHYYAQYCLSAGFQGDTSGKNGQLHQQQSQRQHSKSKKKHHKNIHTKR